MKFFLSAFGLAGALMVALLGFDPASAIDQGAPVDQSESAPSARNTEGYIISGHGGGLGSCGNSEPDQSAVGMAPTDKGC
ncbi:MAG: hypothetical protein ACPGVA_12855 [Pikeienuella sp.]